MGCWWQPDCCVCALTDLSTLSTPCVVWHTRIPVWKKCFQVIILNLLPDAFIYYCNVRKRESPTPIIFSRTLGLDFHSLSKLNNLGLFSILASGTSLGQLFLLFWGWFLYAVFFEIQDQTYIWYSKQRWAVVDHDDNSCTVISLLSDAQHPLCFLTWVQVWENFPGHLPQWALGWVEVANSELIVCLSLVAILDLFSSPSLTLPYMYLHWISSSLSLSVTQSWKILQSFSLSVLDFMILNNFVT